MKPRDGKFVVTGLSAAVEFATRTLGLQLSVTTGARG
jgi:hypothetical protein